MNRFFKNLGWAREQTVVFFLLIVFFTCLLANQIELPAGDDMARHLVNGREILHGNFDALYKNVYSYTMPEASFVNHHWLSGLVFYLLYLAGGWYGLVVFKILVLLGVFTLLFFLSLRRANFWLVAILSVPMLIVFAERGSLRPEIFSYLFLTVFLYFLIDYKANAEKSFWKDKIFFLLPLQVLWVNMHVFFILGPAIVAGLIIEKLILSGKKFTDNPEIKRLTNLFLGLVALCLINPNGFRGALYPLQILEGYGMNVAENQSLLEYFRHNPSLGNISITVFVAVILVFAGSLFWVFRNGHRPVFLSVVGVVTALGGVFMRRLVAIFAIIALPVISSNLSEPFERLKNYIFQIPRLGKILPKVLVTLFILMLFSLIYMKGAGKMFYHYKTGLGLAPHSMDSVRFWNETGINGPIFNDYDIGSFLIYNFYPKEKVFVDNRPEAYSQTFFEDEYTMVLQDEDVWQEAQNKHGFNTIYFYRYDEGHGASDFLYRRLADPEWALVYIDPYTVIFARNNSSNKAIVDKYKITQENIEERMSFLISSEDIKDKINAADNFNFVGRTDLGMKTFFDVVEERPDLGRVWMVMGEWELGNDNPKSPLLALSYLKNALDAGHRTAEVYTFIGAAYMRMEYWDRAREALEKSLKINPNREDTKELLQILEEKQNNFLPTTP